MYSIYTTNLLSCMCWKYIVKPDSLKNRKDDWGLVVVVDFSWSTILQVWFNAIWSNQGVRDSLVKLNIIKYIVNIIPALVTILSIDSHSYWFTSYYSYSFSMFRQGHATPVIIAMNRPIDHQIIQKWYNSLSVVKYSPYIDILSNHKLLVKHS